MISMNNTYLPLLLTAALMAFGVGCDQEDDAVPNSVPSADAGMDLTTSVTLPTSLDGTGSYDPDEGDVLTFHWSFESVPEASALTDGDIAPNGTADADAPSFVADAQGVYVVRLFVDDGLTPSTSDFVHVMADIEGSLPVAEAGEDQFVTEGVAVALDGSASHDPQDNPLTYTWYLVSTPDNSQLTTEDIQDADKVQASLVTDAPGTFLVGLQVNNGTQESVPDFASVYVDTTNQCPEPQAVTTGVLDSCTAIAVDATGSSDPDGDLLNYSWRHLLPPYESLLVEDDFADPEAAQTTFFADKPGTYVLQVTVNDGECESEPKQLDVEVQERPYNTGPTAAVTGGEWYADFADCTQVGQNWWCDSCDELEIELSAASSQDADGDPLTYHWESLHGDQYPQYQQADIDDPSAETMTATMLDAWTEYQTQITHQYMFQLTVTDCMGDSVTEQFDVAYGCTGI